MRKISSLKRNQPGLLLVGDREARAGLSIFLGMLLAIFFISANILLCLVTDSLWNLALALYHGLLMLSRYYAFDVYKSPEILTKISKMLSAASLFMALMILYSGLIYDFSEQTGAGFLLSLVYSIYTLFRVVFSLMRRDKPPLFSLVLHLRLLSLFSSMYSVLPRLLSLGALGYESRRLFIFACSFFSSYLLLATLKFSNVD